MNMKTTTLFPAQMAPRDGFVIGATPPAALDMYLNEMGRIPLLTAEEEVALAQRVEQGDEAAAAALAQANLRLVVRVARQYAHAGLPLEDLIAEGNLGLLHAVSKYDWRRGYKFSTYAVWWIRQSVVRAIADKGPLIRLPSHVVDELNRRARELNELALLYGHDVENDERDSPILQAALAAAQPPLSLDRALDEGEDGLAAFLRDPATPEPEEEAVRRSTMRDLQRILREVLNTRERLVITLRFGLGKTPPRTLDAVGQMLGVTRERARQIETRALEKLRRPSIAAQLGYAF